MACSTVQNRVHLACRAIFTRQTALVRKQKKIRELVEQRKTSFKPLFTELGVEGLVEVLKVLLDDRIFESELRAKEMFPDLFLPSPVRDIQRAESEYHAVQSVAEALGEIESPDQTRNTLEDENEGHRSQSLYRPVTETLNNIEYLDEIGDRLGDHNDDKHERRYFGLDGTVSSQNAPLSTNSTY